MRIVLSIFIGIVVNFLVIFGFEILSHSFISVPTLASNEKPDYSATTFNGILTMIFIAHLVGLIAGLFVAKQIEENSTIPLFFIAFSMLVGSLVNIAMIPHPLWFSIIDPLGLLLVTLVVYRWNTKSAV